MHAALHTLINREPELPQGDPLLTADKSTLWPAYTAALEQLISTSSSNGPASASCSASQGPGPAADPSCTPLQGHQFHTVDVVDCCDLTDAEFMTQYMAANKPVLIKGAMAGWRALREWVAPDGSPEVSALEAAAGRGAAVTVVDTGQQQEGVGPCLETTLGRYLDWWRGRGRGRGTGEEEGGVQGDQPLPTGHWYLKDWHFVAACPGYEAYSVPSFLSSDWLNDHFDMLLAQQHHKETQGTQQQAFPSPSEADAPQGWSEVRCSDYRFVYLGPQGSWTPLHSDVLRSYSWSANVAGTKRWLLLPPEHTYLAYDVTLNTSAADWGLSTSPCPASPCTAPQHPTQPTTTAAQPQQQGHHSPADQFPVLQMTQPLLHEVVQGPGELLFVPSGWHHTVTNLTDTLSINHNWMNAHNIHWCWRLVSTTHLRAAASIQDCRALCSGEEWWELVQNMVAADCGLHLRGLAHLCAGVITRSLCNLTAEHTCHCDQAQGPSKAGKADPDSPVVLQALLDIKRAQGVLGKVVQLVRSSGLGAETGCTQLRTPEELCACVEQGSHAEFLAGAAQLLVLASQALEDSGQTLAKAV